MRKLEASPPILLQISFMEMNGVRMAADRSRFFDEPPPYNRDVLHLPSLLITEYRDDGNYEAIIAEQMSFLWNVYDFEKCFYFDMEGKWIGK